jgi:hypothetical protein
MKDVGRKIKCKKCAAALRVTEKGLEEDDGRAAEEPAVAEADDRDRQRGSDDRDDDRPAKQAKTPRERRGPAFDPTAAIAAVGGIPTVMFGFGVFLVIVFTSFPLIGAAATQRTAVAVDRLKLEQAAETRALLPRGKKVSELSPDEQKTYDEKRKKVEDEYERKIADAGIDAERTKIGNIRDVWYEQYGLMFGFLFTAFGCIGYLRTEQPLVLKIVAAVVLGVMLIVMFGKFGGCTGLR